MNSFKQYREILGINRRNQEYVRPFNPPSSKKISDNKILTKKILAKAGIKTTKAVKIIRSRTQLDFFDWESLPKSFVVKPNRGTGGNGIIVFYGKRKGELAWIRSNHKIMTKEQLRIHFEKILDGSFSMGDAKDTVIVEERIVNHHALKKYSFRGVPDIRLIIFNKIPVMAMIRFPTKFSDGKANLHAGGICTGIDISTGLTTDSIQLKSKSFLENTYRKVEYTSDFEENNPLRNIKIPFWDKILEIAIKCQEITNIGFLGVDIAIDENLGPLIIELNSRPGLGIQMANKAGLRPRLERIKDINIKSSKRAIRLAKTLFGGEAEEAEILGGKEVLNLIENVTIYHAEETKTKRESQTIRALLDTGITTSRIDEGLASRMGYDKTISHFRELDIKKEFENINDAKEITHKHNENKDNQYRLAVTTESAKTRVKPVVKVKIRLAEEIKEIEAIVSTQKETIYPLLIGRRDLKNYLIDAGKTFVK